MTWFRREEGVKWFKGFAGDVMKEAVEFVKEAVT